MKLKRTVATRSHEYNSINKRDKGGADHYVYDSDSELAITNQDIK